MRSRYTLAALLVAVAALAVPVGAAQQPRVNVQLKDTLVGDAVRAVCAQCRVRCVVDGKVTGRVQGLSLSDVPLETALAALARYADAKVELHGNTYIVKPKQ